MKNTHLEHLEDNILNDGSQGGKEAVAPEWLDAIKSYLTPISNFDNEDEE